MTTDVLILSTPNDVGAGAILAALHKQYGIPSEAIGVLQPTSSGIEIEVAFREARRLVTPAPLTLAPHHRIVIRRRRDLPEAPPPFRLRLADSSQGAGGLASALYDKAGISGEDVGRITQHSNGELSFELPRWRYRERDLPTEIEGAPVQIEKKKPTETDQNGLLRVAPTAAAALERVADQCVSSTELARTVRRALGQSRKDDELAQAASRLVASGYRPNKPVPALSTGLLILSQALQPTSEWRKHLSALQRLPFPTEAQRANEETLQSLLSESQGEAVPDATPFQSTLQARANNVRLETRALSTICPGLQDNLASEPIEGDDLWSQWCQLALEAAAGRPIDDALCSSLDERVRTEAAHSGSDIGRWPELLQLLRAQARGEASPVQTPSDELEPGSPRYEESHVRRIDALVQQGHWKEACHLAVQSSKAAPSSGPLARRAIRLSGSTTSTVDDDVCLVLAGEAAFRSGKKAIAEATLAAVSPSAGSPTADHAARRLAEWGRHRAAWRLISSESHEDVRLRVARRLALWTDAVEAWAKAQGDELGFNPIPDWADAGVRAALPPAYVSLLEGALTTARTHPELKDLCDHALRRTSSSLRDSDDTPIRALQIIYETPDARVPLRALCRSIRTEAASVEWRPLLLHLTREIPVADWNADTLEALSTLDQRFPFAAILVRALPETLFTEWLEAECPDLSATAAQLLLRIEREVDTLPLSVTETLHHTTVYRADKARRLLDQGKEDEAAHLAAAALRKARSRRGRVACLRILLVNSEEAPLLRIVRNTEGNNPTINDLVLALEGCEHRPPPLMSALKRADTSSLPHRTQSLLKTLLDSENDPTP